MFSLGNEKAKSFYFYFLKLRLYAGPNEYVVHSATMKGLSHTDYLFAIFFSDEDYFLNVGTLS